MYGKFFESTFSGSMVGAGPNVFAVWGYIVSHVRKGRVELNPVLIAAILGTDAASVEKAIEYLCAPDPRSRNKEHEGRRMIREGEFQYFVTGHAKYSAMRDEDDRREYNRVKKAESRARVKLSKGESKIVSHGQPQSAHTDPDADPDADPESKDIGAKGSRPTSKTPEQIIAECSASPAYSGIDVAREWAKMIEWCKRNHGQPTERRFINWLNRADKPLQTQSQKPKPDDLF